MNEMIAFLYAFSGSVLLNIITVGIALALAGRCLYTNYHHKKLLLTLRRSNIFITFFNQHHKVFSTLTKRRAKLVFRELTFKTFSDFLDQFEDSEQEGIQLAFNALKKEARPISLTLTTKKGQRLYRLSAHCFRGNTKWAVVTLHDVTFFENEKSALRLECKMLSTSLEFYKKAFDNLPWPVWIRRDHELLYFNPLCAQLLDVEIFEKADITVERLKHDFLSSTQPKAIILTGERRLYNFQEKVLSPEIKIGFGEDLTKVYEQERKLQNHLASYREVLNSLSAGVSIYDSDQNMRYFNQAYARMFDFDENWLSKAPHLGEVLDDLRSRRLLTEHADYNAYKKGQIQALQTLSDAIENLTHLPDGRIIRIISSPHPTGGSFYIFEDLTDRLNLEAKYNTQLAVYNATLDNLFEGVSVFGSDNRLQFSNKAFAKLWNIDPSSMRKGERLSVLADQAKHLFDPNRNWERYKNRVMEIVTDRQPKKRKINRHDGTIIEFSYVPLPDGSNLMSYYDVTDQTKLEKALEERKIAQENADRLKSDFISKISYEMRTPLNAIIGYSELLSQEYGGSLNDQQKIYCSDILSSSKRLLSLVNNILDLAMIESGHIQLKREKCDFWALFDEALKSYNQQSDPLCGALKADIPLEKAIIQGDPKHLKQALETLLMQATSDIEYNGNVLFKLGQKENFITADITLPLYENGSNEKRIRKDHKVLICHLAPGKTLGFSLSRHIIEAHGATFEHITINPTTTLIKLRFPLVVENEFPLRVLESA